MTQHSSLFITIVGAPNAGKSTLLNNLVGTKLAIVTPKVQTTRSLINGIIIHNNSQLIFIDTPGIFKAKQKLEQVMVKTAIASIKDADEVILMIDCNKVKSPENLELIQLLAKKKIKSILVLNKIDLIKKKELELLVAEFSINDNFKKIFLTAAIRKEGLLELKDYLASLSIIGQWPYPEDDITTLPKRFLASELVREQLFLKLAQELPYNLAVETELWEELASGEVKVHQVIYTTKETHKRMIIGKGGELIKLINIRARAKLERILDQKVHLFLFVKVRPDWVDDYNNIYQS